jgi:predicted AAA+ superfamily ATPase
MREVSRQDVIERIRFENPWWASGEIDPAVKAVRPRAYLQAFLRLVNARSPHRALLLMGPRRVGKTWMIFHAIQDLLRRGLAPARAIYLNVQNPLYNGWALEHLLHAACEAAGASPADELVVCFDEIQYLREWEVHLKTLVDSYRHIKFVGSGSAAAALKLKSAESGAGRFTDFLLPPLTFYEYLDLLGNADLVQVTQMKDGQERRFEPTDLRQLNESFVQYLNYGGYPEVVLSPQVQADPGRFVRGDIIDKVLMKDLPSLYGIHDIQELNSLFQNLVYNTAGEISLEQLAQKSGVAKNTIKKYIEYLESAFLVKVVHRIDHTARRFQRANQFKVYITNPSLYCALFSPVNAESEEMGALVETAVFSQWFHAVSVPLYYARWKEGEVDIVHLNENLKPAWGVEVKWSDDLYEHPRRLALFDFLRRHPECRAAATTKTKRGLVQVDDLSIDFVPASTYCYELGYNIIAWEGSRRIGD